MSSVGLINQPDGVGESLTGTERFSQQRVYLPALASRLLLSEGFGEGALARHQAGDLISSRAIATPFGTGWSTAAVFWPAEVQMIGHT